MTSESARKPVHFIASSLKDLHALPDPVRGVFGRLLLDVQYGEMPYGAKPLKGFGGASVLDLVRSRYELARQHHAQHYPVASRTEKHDA